ncbi:BLUF domain-containing protein [Stieleria marina]|uniref:Blue light-and temperature-regulated antirepressor YcgF n=1 Tax=Stieleria marina TaxID=1930275 RepID=A0A517NYI2_9BACT|nr:Blue light- and temperature-regulated antirepressor YcgF [Planctomycetes bacterium K23_9]
MSADDTKKKLVQLVYASASTVSFSDEQLDKLLEYARQNNSSLDVTGMLLFVDGTFFQVLEGDPDTVHALYDKIQLDQRHNNVLMLAERNIEERNFGQWSMGFVRSQKEIAELPGFIDFFSDADDQKNFIDLHGDSKRIDKILEGFRRGRWRREADPINK